MSRPWNAAFALGLSAAVALLSLSAGRFSPFPDGSFLPSSFVTHSVMVILSLALGWALFRGNPASFGLTRGTYRFRPAILLWALPTAVLSALAIAASGSAEDSGPLADRSKLQIILFVWVYASLCEEVLTRGLLQTLLSRDRAPVAGSRRLSSPVVLSALFFGAMHLVLVPSMGAAAAAPILLAVFLGWIAARYREATGSLLPAVIVHALFNIGGSLPFWIAGWLAG
jgi:membrane protease YdiL (CAAX protease family)